MRLGLLDEDKELQNESDQLQMWIKTLEKLKQDCFNFTKELEHNKIWMYKIEAQIDLLSKLNIQHSPTSDLYCTSNTVIDDENEQDKFISSSDKTPVKNGTSQNVYFFGSNEKSPVLDFTFCKIIPNVGFNVPEKAGCNEAQIPEKGRIKLNGFYNFSKNKGHLTSSIQKAIIKARRVLNKPIVVPNCQTADKEEINNKSSSDDNDKNSTNNSIPTVKNYQILPDEQPINEIDWKNNISLEINEVQKSLSEFKKELKVNSKWRKSIEKKLNEIASTHQSYERNDKTEFVTLNKKIDKHYINIQESIVEIKQSQMSRNELICRLNDLKELIFDKLGMSLLEERKHENNNFACKLQDLSVKWEKLEPLLTKIETNETVRCTENVESNRRYFFTLSTRENDKVESETNNVDSPVAERVSSIGTNNSSLDELQMKSAEDNMQKWLKVKINDPTLSQVIDVLDRHENTQSNSRESYNLLVTQATEELQSSNNKNDEEIKHNDSMKEVLLGKICSIEKDKTTVGSSFQESYDTQLNNNQEKDFVIISTAAEDLQTSNGKTNIGMIHNSSDSNKPKETPLENICSFEKLTETRLLESSVMISHCQKMNPTYNCKTSHFSESTGCIENSTSAANSSPIDILYSAANRHSQLLSKDSEQCIDEADKDSLSRKSSLDESTFVVL